MIYWVTLNGMSNSASLHAAPLEVAPVLEVSLFGAKDCVVLTSATMTSEDSFDYLRQRLGLSWGRELALSSPFDYARSTLICFPHDMPEPGHADYEQTLAECLAALGQATDGRTLALFTSHAALRFVHGAITRRLEESGITVLGQGIDGAAKQLLVAFQDNPRAVLLGAASFWEGVDVVGEALSVLVITRIPFSVPTDPVFSARSETFEDPFLQYALPLAILRFKQGFGRLIRSRSDRGVVVVLDKRVQSRRYGSAFIDSLPTCSVHQGPIRDLPERVAEWLELE
jgi:DNA polymerase-3 subunit epsilon/ATP-dependent DNA helicase DinG